VLRREGLKCESGAIGRLYAVERSALEMLHHDGIAAKDENMLITVWHASSPST